MTSLGAVLRLVVLRARHDRTVLAGAAVIVLLATSLVAAGLIYADAVASAGLHRTRRVGERLVITAHRPLARGA